MSEPRLRSIVWALSVLALAGCRAPGLAAEPPGQDATDPAATAPPPPKAPPLSRSAFEGVRPAAGGHAHHHHGARPKPAAQKEKADE